MTIQRSDYSGRGLPLTPMLRLGLAATLFAAAALMALWSATSQPWLGLVMSPGDDGLVVLRDIERDDLASDLTPGMRVDQIGPFEVTAEDFIEEPDTLESYAALNQFRARQSQLQALLEVPPVPLVVTGSDGVRRTVAVTPLDNRPVWSLPFEFWLQLVVGGAGILLGSWVWALRRDAASAYLAVSGAGLMLSALSASVYSSRELALDGDLLRLLGAGNYIGTSTFGWALISLLLVYPRRIASGAVIAALWLVGAALAAAHVLQLMPSQAVGSYAPMLAQFVILFGLIALQVYVSRRNPLARAALGWFGLSILLGTAVFTFAIAMPVLLGFEPQVRQAHAFSIILLIYAGLAIGVARYRLFDLGVWSFRLVSYLFGGLVLIALDAVLVSVVALERAPAFGIALLVVAVLYLPLRNMLGAALTRSNALDATGFRQIVDIALARGIEQEARWQGLLSKSFAPLNIKPVESTAKAALLEGGQGLVVPATSATSAFAMWFADGGRRLFTRADAKRVQDLTDLMAHALASRTAHEQGAREERTRIARDLHDNIGAQLLRTLHSADTERKNAIVSETLADLRDIINHARSGGVRLQEILAELRFETNERLDAVGMDLDWQAHVEDTRFVDARMAHTLRSIIREAASNAIRHAGASRFSLDLQQDASAIRLHLADNGTGFDGTGHRRDGGLSNMSARAQGHGGTFKVATDAGVRIDVVLPLERTEA